jgi:hypothetical protein
MQNSTAEFSGFLGASSAESLKTFTLDAGDIKSSIGELSGIAAVAGVAACCEDEYGFTGNFVATVGAKHEGDILVACAEVGAGALPAVDVAFDVAPVVVQASRAWRPSP